MTAGTTGEVVEINISPEHETKPGILRGLVHRGGLRAAILTEGEIVVGDVVAPGESRDAQPR